MTVIDLYTESVVSCALGGHDGNVSGFGTYFGPEGWSHSVSSSSLSADNDYMRYAERVGSVTLSADVVTVAAAEHSACLPDHGAIRQMDQAAGPVTGSWFGQGVTWG